MTSSEMHFLKLFIIEHDNVIKWKHFPLYWHLMRVSTVCRWIPFTKSSDAELWYFLRSGPEQTVEQTIATPMIWDVIALIMTSLKELGLIPRLSCKSHHQIDQPEEEAKVVVKFTGRLWGHNDRNRGLNSIPSWWNKIDYRYAIAVKVNV